MRYTVNVVDIESALESLHGTARANMIHSRVLERFCNSEIPDNYLNERSFRQTIQRKIENHCPQAAGFEGAQREAVFIRVGRGVYSLAAKESSIIAEEITSEAAIIEGATRSISVNSYERSVAARNICVAHYGYDCVVCGFNFESAYGVAGQFYIHVHHVVPLATIQRSYEIDPVADLRPVCANCHAIIHRTSPAMSIDEAKALVLAGKSRVRVDA
jgi:5-methylcytosine-specific restriction protein A